MYHNPWVIDVQTHCLKISIFFFLKSKISTTTTTTENGKKI